MKHLLEIHETKLKSLISNIKDNRKELELTAGTIQRCDATRCIALAVTKLEEAELWIEKALNSERQENS